MRNIENLQLFTNTEFGSVRVMTIDNKPYFVGKDIATILGYSNPSKAILNHVDDEDKQFIMVEITDSQKGNVPIGQTKTAFINESGLYSLILSSKMPKAKEFKRWVTSEVLPSIHSNGGYIIGQETISDEELMARALLVAQNKIAEKQRQIEIMQPKADYFDALCDKNLLTNFRDTAKELHLKERDFIKWLESRKFIYRDKKNNIKPYAEYSTGTKPYFEIKEYSNGDYVGTQTLVTPRGREAFKMLTEKLLA